jgi:hypothetical protein
MRQASAIGPPKRLKLQQHIHELHEQFCIRAGSSSLQIMIWAWMNHDPALKARSRYPTDEFITLSNLTKWVESLSVNSSNMQQLLTWRNCHLKLQHNDWANSWISEQDGIMVLDVEYNVSWCMNSLSEEDCSLQVEQVAPTWDKFSSHNLVTKPENIIHKSRRRQSLWTNFICFCTKNNILARTKSCTLPRIIDELVVDKIFRDMGLDHRGRLLQETWVGDAGACIMAAAQECGTCLAPCMPPVVLVKGHCQAP